MAYTEIKTIYGHRYAYLRESYRIPGTNIVRHKNIAYLGSVEGIRAHEVVVRIPEKERVERPTVEVKEPVREREIPIGIKKEERRKRLERKVPKIVMGEAGERAVIEEIKKKKKRKKGLKKKRGRI